MLARAIKPRLGFLWGFHNHYVVIFLLFVKGGASFIVGDPLIEAWLPCLVEMLDRYADSALV